MVIVPDNTRQAVVDAFGGQGLKVANYKAGDNADRMRVMREQASEETRFSVEEDENKRSIDDVIAKAREDGTLGKAPNGQPSKLVEVGDLIFGEGKGEELWARVRTPQFKSWFGDWEKPVRIEKLRKSEPIEITGKEITPSNDINIGLTPYPMDWNIFVVNTRMKIQGKLLKL